jgi:uncharacterized protein DUF2786/SprT-like family protein
MTESLPVALEAALVRQLAETWAEINHNHFRGRLRRPVIALSDGGGRLGAWHSQRREISLGRALVLGQPWGAVREVLKHEMAHQFVDEAMGVHDQGAHGPAFEALCRRHGIDASATGVPAVGEDGSDGVLRRVARLLALAGSPNVHEAEAAMQQARRLMLKHNLDSALVASRSGFTFRQVGTPRGRVDAHEHLLASILADHFFVEVIWVPSYAPLTGRGGRVLELCGTPSNLEVAAYVHGFLLETGERLWRQHKQASALPGDRERRRFLLGVMIGFEEKLARSAVETTRDGLIWTGDPALAAYLRRRYPRRSGGGAIGFQRTAAHEQGRRAGKQIVLHRPIEDRRGNRGRLLLP